MAVYGNINNLEQLLKMASLESVKSSNRWHGG
jgi:hypothetical protein